MSLVENFASQMESLRQNSAEFSHLGDQVYLDHAANAIYMSSLVTEFGARLTARDSLFSNPHSHSQSAQYTHQLISVTREKILSRLFGTDSHEFSLVFTHNASHALKLLAECFDFEQELETAEINNNSSNDQKASFVYSSDNHTSVVGMREIVWQRTSPSTSVFCAKSPDSISLVPRPSYANNQARNSASSMRYNNLLIYPAQSNFNGERYVRTKFAESIVARMTTSKNKWFVCVDAASYTSTSKLDLSCSPHDFLALSFYKMFGFPTGLGALLIRRRSGGERVLLQSKRYFAGGTIQMALIDQSSVQPKQGLLHERLEEGTLPYLDIIAVSLAIDKFEKLTFCKQDGFALIDSYLAELSSYFEAQLRGLTHANGTKLVELYRDAAAACSYGPVFAFNLKTSRSNYISFTLVDKLVSGEFDYA